MSNYNEIGLSVVAYKSMSFQNGGWIIIKNDAYLTLIS